MFSFQIVGMTTIFIVSGQSDDKNLNVFWGPHRVMSLHDVFLFQMHYIKYSLQIILKTGLKETWQINLPEISGRTCFCGFTWQFCAENPMNSETNENII